ncbi:conserved membrane protein of unknown function [Burkholderia multivorans]
MYVVEMEQPGDMSSCGTSLSPSQVNSTANVTTLVLAVFVTAVSLAIAAFGGWQRGGTFAEQMIDVALAAVAVLFVHLMPSQWRALGLTARVIAGVLWLLGLVVVVSGQAAFILLSQQRAGNIRAASVLAITMPTVKSVQDDRNLTLIAGDIVKVSTELARVQSRGCERRCSILVVRKAALTARLAALNIEADEVKRHEAEADRIAAHVERDAELRDSLRADPVASHFARSFGTTESPVMLGQAVASAVVLEGAAILAWLSVVVAPDRVVRRANRAGDSSAAAMSQPTMIDVAPIARGDDALNYPMTDARALVLSDDERVLDHIHAAVRAGRLKPTQKSIREFVGCGQKKAGDLNRLYAERFGRAIA